jgi:beta-galactosidase/beta-glucuronidase
VRAGQGLVLNGQRLMLKGINRHSYRPESRRTVSRAQAHENARLIKSMNMNTMRVAHRAPEKAFLDAADRLGLYVINELSGRQQAHGTEAGGWTCSAAMRPTASSARGARRSPATSP